MLTFANLHLSLTFVSSSTEELQLVPAAEHLHRPCYLNDMGPGWAGQLGPPTTHLIGKCQNTGHSTRHIALTQTVLPLLVCKDYFNLNVVCDNTFT